MTIEEAIVLYKNTQKWAVIGVTEKEEKFGYRIYKRLKEKGKTVYGISAKYHTIDDDILYKSILDIPEKVDIVVFVVNPAIGYEELDKVKEMGIETIWLQPGTTSPEFLQKAEQMDFTMSDKCVLVVSDKAK